MLQQHLLSLLTLSVQMFGASDGWKAINFNEARHAVRSDEDYSYANKLRRDYQHSTYRFGQCDRENLVRKFLRKQIRMKISTAAEAPHNYIYLLAQKNTINHRLQCVVMKIFTNRNFVFIKSHIPMYYCQGVVNYLMMNSIQRIEVHEFFLDCNFNIPADIQFYFFHPATDY